MDGDHLPTDIAEIKNMRNYTITPPYIFRAINLHSEADEIDARPHNLHV
jgi:hypothetical protein